MGQNTRMFHNSQQCQAWGKSPPSHLHSGASWLATVHPSPQRRCSSWRCWDGCTGSLLESPSVWMQDSMWDYFLYNPLLNMTMITFIPTFEEPLVTPVQTVNRGCTFVELTNSSSMLVWHFSRFILFMATRSCLGIQRAACTTAVAPLPGITTTTQQWQRRQERREQLKECMQSIAAPRPSIGLLVLFTHAFMRDIHHHLAPVLLQTRLIVYLGPYKSDHAGVTKSFPPRSRDTLQMVEQLTAEDKER